MRAVIGECWWSGEGWWQNELIAVRFSENRRVISEVSGLNGRNWLPGLVVCVGKPVFRDEISQSVRILILHSLWYVSKVMTMKD